MDLGSVCHKDNPMMVEEEDLVSKLSTAFNANKYGHLIIKIEIKLKIKLNR